MGKQCVEGSVLNIGLRASSEQECTNETAQQVTLVIKYASVLGNCRLLKKHMGFGMNA